MPYKELKAPFECHDNELFQREYRLEMFLERCHYFNRALSLPSNGSNCYLRHAFSDVHGYAILEPVTSLICTFGFGDTFLGTAKCLRLNQQCHAVKKLEALSGRAVQLNGSGKGSPLQQIWRDHLFLHRLRTWTMPRVLRKTVNPTFS